MNLLRTLYSTKKNVVRLIIGLISVVVSWLLATPVSLAYTISVNQINPSQTTFAPQERVSWQITINNIQPSEVDTQVLLRLTEERSNLQKLTLRGSSFCPAQGLSNVCISLRQPINQSITVVASSFFDTIGQRSIFFSDSQSQTQLASFTYQISGEQDNLPDNGSSGTLRISSAHESEAIFISTINQACEASSISNNTQDVCRSLSDLTLEEQGDLITAITPNDKAAYNQLLSQLIQHQLDTLRSRLHALRSGKSGLDISGLSLSLNNTDIPVGQVINQHLLDNKTSSPLSTPFGLYITGQFIQQQTQTQDSQQKIELNQQSILIGIDTTESKNFHWGSGFAYSASNTQIDNLISTNENKSSTISAVSYFSYYPVSEFFIEGAVTVGQSQWKNDKNLEHLALSKINSSTESYFIGAQMGAGADYQYKRWHYGPYAQLNYVLFSMKSFKEKGFDGLDIHYDSHQQEKLTSLMGLHISNVIPLSDGVLIPSIALDWRHEFDLNASPLTYTINNVQGFTETEPWDQNYWSLSLSSQLMFQNGNSGYLNYSQNIEHDNLDGYQLSLGAYIPF